MFLSFMATHVSNIRDECERLKGRPWTSRDLAFINNHALRLSCAKGEYHWHKHDDADEFCFVFKGKLILEFKDQPKVVLNSGEVMLIPKNTWHRPKSDSETFVLMFQPIHLKMTTK